MALTENQQRTAMFEGYKEKPYLDTAGYPTIGHGEKLENIKYSSDQGVPSHLQGQTRNTDQAGQSLQTHYQSVEQDVSNRFGEHWDGIPDDIKGVILDMGYNVGSQGLFDKFPGFISDIKAGIKSGSYEGAALNLKYKDPALGDNPGNYSDWWEQIGGKSTESNVNTGEWGKDSRVSNRGTANYDILMNYEDPDTALVNNVTTEQGSQAFSY